MRRAIWAMAVCMVLGAPVRGLCQEESASPEQSGTGIGPVLVPHPDEEERPLEPVRTEWSLIPAFGRNTDLGFLIGGVFVLADFDPQHAPYHWRTVNTAAFSVKETPTGATVPWSAVLSQWDITGLWDDNLRIITEASYSRTENEGYFGLGIESDPNAIPRESTPDPNHRYQYLILEPRFRLNARYALSKEVDVWAGTYLRYIDTEVY